jgi:hypothetical protein
VPGATRERLLAGLIGALSTSMSASSVEVVDVGGRRVQIIDGGRRAVYATDGYVFFMYLFSWMDVPEVAPQPPLTTRSLVIETVHTIPDLGR